jgi:C-1 hydroxylase
MSVEKNKTNVRRLNDAINKGNLAILPELIAPGYVFHYTTEVKGPEGLKQSFTALLAAFPDYHQKIENMVAERGLVAVFYTLTGTFKGEMSGIKPTGKKFSSPSAVLARFEGGVQVEAWSYSDWLAWYRQLGIPIPAQ